MADLPSANDISAALNSTFKLKPYTDSDDIDLKLTEVTEGKVSGSEEYENVSMIFQCSEAFPQATYVLNHDTLGDQELFVVPIGVKEQNFEYEVVINRKVKA